MAKKEKTIFHKQFGRFFALTITNKGRISFGGGASFEGGAEKSSTVKAENELTSDEGTTITRENESSSYFETQEGEEAERRVKGGAQGRGYRKSVKKSWSFGTKDDD